jgi:hypothetical protein
VARIGAKRTGDPRKHIAERRRSGSRENQRSQRSSATYDAGVRDVFRDEETSSRVAIDVECDGVEAECRRERKLAVSGVSRREKIRSMTEGVHTGTLPRAASRTVIVVLQVTAEECAASVS